MSKSTNSGVVSQIVLYKYIHIYTRIVPRGCSLAIGGLGLFGLALPWSPSFFPSLRLSYILVDVMPPSRRRRPHLSPRGSCHTAKLRIRRCLSPEPALTANIVPILALGIRRRSF